MFSLLLEQSKNGNVDLNSGSMMKRALKRLQAEEFDSPSQYLDTKLFLLTSNVCERLFSIPEYALTNRRKGILPTNLESQLFHL